LRVKNEGQKERLHTQGDNLWLRRRGLEIFGRRSQHTEGNSSNRATNLGFNTTFGSLAPQSFSIAVGQQIQGKTTEIRAIWQQINGN
jgi:hypothetical protein